MSGIPKKVKVVLIGHTQVGKSSIIERLTKDVFHSDKIPTVGKERVEKIFYFPEEKKSLKMEIWDTIGQEKYHSLSKIFFKGASITILVYDSTSRLSFDKMKELWLPEVINEGREKTRVAANKSDLIAEEAVSENEGESFAKENNAIFKSTSAKTNTGIKELFNELGLEYIRNPPVTEERGQMLEEKIINKSKTPICC